MSTAATAALSCAVPAKPTAPSPNVWFDPGTTTVLFGGVESSTGGWVVVVVVGGTVVVVVVVVGGIVVVVVVDVVVVDVADTVNCTHCRAPSMFPAAS
jgi:uncharacterized membrane protein